MHSWSFGDISANSKKRFYIEFDRGTLTKHTNDAGEAGFQVEGTGTHFQLQARWAQGSGCSLHVDWSATDTNMFTVFPPPPLNGFSSMIGKLGWI